MAAIDGTARRGRRHLRHRARPRRRRCERHPAEHRLAAARACRSRPTRDTDAALQFDESGVHPVEIELSIERPTRRRDPARSCTSARPTDVGFERHVDRSGRWPDTCQPDGSPPTAPSSPTAADIDELVTARRHAGGHRRRAAWRWDCPRRRSPCRVRRTVDAAVGRGHRSRPGRAADDRLERQLGRRRATLPARPVAPPPRPTRPTATPSCSATAKTCWPAAAAHQRRSHADMVRAPFTTGAASTSVRNLGRG